MRVLLVNPPSPERLQGPLLGQQYVAAALLARGCQVQVLDAAACARPRTVAEIVAEVEQSRPDVVAFGLFTRWVWHAYEAMRALRGKVPWLIAGGAHATARPREALEHGCDLVLAGEAEESIVAFVDALEQGRGPDGIAGACFAGGTGPPPRPSRELDRLPEPLEALTLYDPRWYDASATGLPPGGLISSRGCPAHCVFCANYVTGGAFRFRSAGAVVAELMRFHELTGASFVPFWDDTFTADRRRVLELCRAIREEIRFPLRWSALTRANMVTPALLDAMKSAGCVALDFGVESGDDRVLRLIRKGITTAQVERALGWARERDFSTTCNFMLGFPQETPAALENTLRFMERIAPLTDAFSTRGVVVPFPGTPLYDRFHQQYAFTDWWLQERCSRYTPAPALQDFERFRDWYADDPNLELDFFHYPDELRDLIRTCLRYKAEHNLRHFGWLDYARGLAPATAPADHGNRLGSS